MARQRLGVAVLVPAPVDAEVDGMRRALGDGALGRIAAHLTLVPPVNVPADRVGDALDVLRSAAAATAPLRLRLGPATTFQPVNPVVYLAVGGDVDGLHALRDRAFRPPLERPLTHPFVPHVTLADEVAPERIPAALAALADYAVDVTVDRVYLLREEPGRLWRPIADAPFGPPPVIGRGGLPVEVAVSDLVPPDAAGLLAAGFAITARRDGAVVGTATGWTTGPECHVARLVVAPAERRQGVGRHLLTAVDGVARSRGCDRLEALAPATPEATALLDACGWHPSGDASGAPDSPAPAWRHWHRDA
jgi:2'-5' RNA ligase